MTELVSECAHARHLIGIAHVDERMRPLRAPGEGAFCFPDIRVHVHPAILQTAAANCLHILLAQRRKAFTDQLHAASKRNLHLFLRDRSPHVIVGKFLESQCLAANIEVTMPDRQVLFECIDQVVKDIGWDVQIEQRRSQG